MEEQRIQLSEEEYIARLMAEASQEAAQRQAEQEAAAMPAIAQPQAPQRRARKKRSPYRHWALLLAGLLCYALLIALAALVWGSVVFMRQGDVGENTALPLAIFLGSVFLSCCVVTLLSRGGTIFPALFLALIVNILPFLLAGVPEEQLQAQAIAVKLGYTLLVAIAGFVLSKMLYMRRKNKRGPV